ncbi:MAG TPA: DUF1622 domain-containing protein, partial [Solirubrobacteraceae bacterium]|nr:DUF1622 domain-containing protein [Solirubrobacteraceae bacterium]
GRGTCPRGRAATRPLDAPRRRTAATAPSWDQIGKLGAIAVIPTALNFSLGREMNEEGGRVERRARDRSP